MENPNEEKIEGGTAPTAEQEPTVEQLKAKLEEEQALRQLAEDGERNAKRDIVAMKTGRKRDQVAPEELTPESKHEQEITQPPTPAPDLASQLEEERRKSAELARALAAKGQAPVGGSGGMAPSPAPAPKGYWSDTQKAELKKRGWSDEKISKAEKTAQFGSAYGAKGYSEAGYQPRKY